MKHERAADTAAYYFTREKHMLLIITITGILYNIGMVAGPLFEGRLAQCLYDIIGGTKCPADMLKLAAAYALVILFVQGMRFFKRLYVRKFGNDINRRLKRSIYSNLIRRSRTDLQSAGVGTLMTKALSDADACAEGMRKFTTEVFDTGVVMIAYLVMLLVYDWRLTLLSMIFPPVAYIAAELLKKKVTEAAAKSKESTGALNQASLERVRNAMTYRVYGLEAVRNKQYEAVLTDYEKKAVRANFWEASPQPVYQIIAMAGTVMILWFGGKNVLGRGWTMWDIGMFSTFLACFSKLATKSSKAAKLFNAVQKAEVSWKRIKPYLGSDHADDGSAPLPASENAPVLSVRDLSFAYPDGTEIFRNVSFTGKAGEVIGITGPVACGKSTLGQAFLHEYPHGGTIEGLENFRVNYLGHDPELFAGTIEDNIRLGKEGDIHEALRLVCMDREVDGFPDREQTRIGDGGIRLSGGQQARIALARTLFHRESPSLLILDDPFSAVDQTTEQEIFGNLRRLAGGDLILLISHRLSLFPALDRVLWMRGGRVLEGTHGRLMEDMPEYRRLYEAQTGKEADAHEEA